MKLHLFSLYAWPLPLCNRLTLMPPTYEVCKDETVTIDGLNVAFQLTPGTEAPTEMNTYFSDYRALQSHNWPHWGTEIIREYMVNTASVYKFIHDQTLHYINLGLTATEIADTLKLPERLDRMLTPLSGVPRLAWRPSSSAISLVWTSLAMWRLSRRSSQESRNHCSISISLNRNTYPEKNG